MIQLKRKQKGQFFIFILLAGLFIVSCEIDNEKIELSGEVLRQSECKIDATSRENSDYSKEKSFISYSYNTTTNKLLIKHINTSFNCCPGTISCTISMEGNIITITEEAEKAACSCMCLYDVEIEIEDIELKTYTIKMLEPYIGDQEKIAFTINLSSETEGEYSVERSFYPWGS